MAAARPRKPEGHGQVALKKTDVARAIAAEGRFAVKAVAETPGVSGSNLNARLVGGARPRRRCRKTQDARRKTQDAARLPLIATLTAARPTYGCRRITALLNRRLRARNAAPAHHKRVCPLAGR